MAHRDFTNSLTQGKKEGRSSLNSFLQEHNEVQTERIIRRRGFMHSEIAPKEILRRSRALTTEKCTKIVIVEQSCCW